MDLQMGLQNFKHVFVKTLFSKCNRYLLLKKCNEPTNNDTKSK